MQLSTPKTSPRMKAMGTASSVVSKRKKMNLISSNTAWLHIHTLSQLEELMEALDAGRVLEVFGAGTACVVCPVGSLLYKGKVGGHVL